MSKALDVFCEVPCLTEQSRQLSGIALQKKWFKSADKRIIGQYLQKFIDYNSSQFKFIGVQPFIIGSDQNTSVCIFLVRFLIPRVDHYVQLCEFYHNDMCILYKVQSKDYVTNDIGLYLCDTK